MPSLEITKGVKPPVVVILGPTAVGKTEISIQLAERLDGEIVSADSRLLYRGMDIGTAKPSLEERQRVPHHLIDVAEPDEIWSLATFKAEAQDAIAEIHARKRLPLLVGGTGQYIRSIVDDWSIPKSAPDPAMRTALEHWAIEIGADGLHSRLATLDPKAAETIDYRNLRRTIRALEVVLTTGKRFSAQRRSGVSPYSVLQLGLIRPREELYARIDLRIENMVEAGLVDEVRRLLDRGYPADLPTLTAIGYRELTQYHDGQIPLEEAIVLIKRATRTFVRRQANWFKPDDPNIHWFHAGPDSVSEMTNMIEDWLNSYISLSRDFAI